MLRKTSAPNMSAGRFKILQQLCSTPTAPFAEHRVAKYVRDFVARRPALQLKEDRFGNLLLELARAPGGNTGRWVFTAHMDHPGFVTRRMINAKTLEADFYGGVAKEYFKGAKVRLFDTVGETRATVLSHAASEDGSAQSAILRVDGPVAVGTLGMWDQGEGRVRGGVFHSRVCDDLAGAAAALAMLDRLAANPPEAPVAVLLTRAEEEGFIGAVAATRKPSLLRKSDRLVAIECSSAQPHAPVGGGAIVRVGDRSSVFHPAITHFISTLAIELAAKNKAFKHQRALMPGGTCEATVYNLYGFAAGSVCVPLGNYHNMDKARKKIAPEFINLRDWSSMVDLFLAIAKRGHEYRPDMPALRKRIETRYKRFNHLLEATAR